MSNNMIKRAYATAEYTMHEINELKKCQSDPIYFMTNYVMIQEPTKGAVKFNLFDYQIDMVKGIHENKDTIVLASRQLGKTTVVAMYILWFALFNSNKKCIIASKAMGHATEIMSRIKYAYEELPHWLKAGCKYYSRTSIEFDNKSKIKCEATSEKTGRGDSPSILFVDEIAFISRRVQEEMWASLTPALSSPKAKFILTSTPNGDSDLFATLWRGANSGTNNFKPMRVMWHQHPDRGEAYYADMKGKLGELKTRQELDCEFLSSDALLISSIKLAAIRTSKPLYKDMGFNFWVNPEELGGYGKTYMVFLDPATGSGNDHSTIEVFDFPGLNQVAEYRTNDVHIPLMYAKLKWILNKLSELKGRHRAEVLWSFERNGVGEAVAALYMNDETQPEHVELFSDDYSKLGVATTGRNKIMSCLQLKQFVEKTNGGLQVNSEILLEEMKNFQAKGGSYAAKQGSTDDCVMATIGIMRLLKRLSESNEQAFAMTHEYVDPEMSLDESDLPVPFFI